MMTSITCFPSIYLLNSSFCNWAICLFILFCLLPHAAILYTSQAPSGLQTQQILYVPVSALMVTSITCFPSIYLLSNSCSALTSWCDCSLSFLSSSLFLYTRAQGPSGLRTQQILYVPVSALMMTSITCFPSIYLLNSSFCNWAICLFILFCLLPHAAILYTSQAPSGLQTQQILYVPVSALMVISITCFPSIYLLSNSCSALTSWCDCSLSFLSSSLFLYTRAQGPSGLRTQQILYVPVSALMMTSITCFPSIYLLTLSIFTWITCWNSSVSSLSFSFCLYMSQAPSGLRTQQILYVPVSALMMPSITSFPRTYFLIKVFQSSCLSASIRFLSSS